MYASSFIARAKAALQGSETEQRIAVLLYDDSVQVVSSFELNQMASLTYHECTVLTSSRHDMMEIILEHLEQIMTNPINFSNISVQKALVVTNHLLLHGAEKVVPCIKQQLGRPIDSLRQYNTVLAAQQQSSSTAWLLRLKGGGVDTAGPVRDLSERIYGMLCNMQRLQFERCTSADPNSLVPVGDRKQVAFVTDEVRFEQLKKRMQEEQRIMTRSNLAKASDGFGSGYMAANGKSVVGAAHGIEEMLKQKQKEEQRFSDESKKGLKSTTLDASSFSEYLAPDIYDTETVVDTRLQYGQRNDDPDLLSLDNFGCTITSAPVNNPLVSTEDLLDFADSGSCFSSAQNLQQQDLLYEPVLHSTTAAVPQHLSTTNNDLFAQPFVSHPVTWSSPPLASQSTTSPNFINPTIASCSTNNGTVATLATNQQSVLNLNSDRFAALDDLAGDRKSGSSYLSSTIMPAAFADLAPFTTEPNAGAPSRNISGLNSSIFTGTAVSSMMQTQSDKTNFAFSIPNTSMMSSIQVSQPLGGVDGERGDSGFLMGGSSGTGLEPIGQAPGTAPPPPPPSRIFY
jgi:ENTH domain